MGRSPLEAAAWEGGHTQGGDFWRRGACPELPCRGGEGRGGAPKHLGESRADLTPPHVLPDLSRPAFLLRCGASTHSHLCPGLGRSVAPLPYPRPPCRPPRLLPLRAHCPGQPGGSGGSRLPESSLCFRFSGFVSGPRSPSPVGVRAGTHGFQRAELEGVQLVHSGLGRARARSRPVLHEARWAAVPSRARRPGLGAALAHRPWQAPRPPPGRLLLPLPRALSLLGSNERPAHRSSFLPRLPPQGASSSVAEPGSVPVSRLASRHLEALVARCSRLPGTGPPPPGVLCAISSPRPSARFRSGEPAQGSRSSSRRRCPERGTPETVCSSGMAEPTNHQTAFTPHGFREYLPFWEPGSKER